MRAPTPSATEQFPPGSPSNQEKLKRCQGGKTAGLLCCRRPERAQRDVDGDAVVLLDQLLGRG